MKIMKMYGKIYVFRSDAEKAYYPECVLMGASTKGDITAIRNHPVCDPLEQPLTPIEIIRTLVARQTSRYVPVFEGRGTFGDIVYKIGTPLGSSLPVLDRLDIPPSLVHVDNFEFVERAARYIKECDALIKNWLPGFLERNPGATDILEV